MDRYKETFETWNKVALLYQDKFMNLDLYNSSYRSFCTSIDKQKAKILEIACGPGNITQYLLTQRPDFDIFGIDIAPKMVELAKQNNPTANFSVMDCRQINTLNEKYEGVISGFCLPYLSETESRKLISDAYEILNKNGVIYLSFVEGNPDKSEFKVNDKGRVFFYYHNLDNIKSYLENAKFTNIKVYKIRYKKSNKENELHVILTGKK